MPKSLLQSHSSNPPPKYCGATGTEHIQGVLDESLEPSESTSAQLHGRCTGHFTRSRTLGRLRTLVNLSSVNGQRWNGN
ncbi:hypothetical protein LSAT2_016036 [Lamellibrachia satsuma]|nr:hypothetical protein LSAT2_016036 [Lamellibrachia satsuma]